MDKEKLSLSTTTSGALPEPGFENAGAPTAVDPATGQRKAYWVLTEKERSKGFVRPVRTSYRHVGIPGPLYPLRDLTEEEQDRYNNPRLTVRGYVKFEVYPDDHALAGMYWTQLQLDSIGNGCGVVTTMSLAIAETYARDPHYYGETFCIHCQRHLRVGEHGEFVWDDNTRVGT